MRAPCVGEEQGEEVESIVQKESIVVLLSDDEEEEEEEEEAPLQPPSPALSSRTLKDALKGVIGRLGHRLDEPLPHFCPELQDTVRSIVVSNRHPDSLALGLDQFGDTIPTRLALAAGRVLCRDAPVVFVPGMVLPDRLHLPALAEALDGRPWQQGRLYVFPIVWTGELEVVDAFLVQAVEQDTGIACMVQL